MSNFATNVEVHKARLPINFDGTQEKFVTWFRTLNLYIIAHPDIFKEDKAKIILALSYMTGGLANNWAELYTIKRTNANNEIEFGTWKDFVEELKNFFDTKKAREEALAHVTHEKGQLEAYILRFNMLATRAGFKLEGEDKLTTSKLLGIFFARMDVSLCQRIRTKVSWKIDTLSDAQHAARIHDGASRKHPLEDFPLY